VANPYADLPETAFWRTAVAQCSPLEITKLWTSKFPITQTDKIITAGSCFAQHIGNELVRAGYSWHDAEPGPHVLLRSARRTFNYGVFSFRTGNIYTAALLQQWIRWAVRLQPPSNECWEEKGRFVDPFRPGIEPNGFASRSEMFATRAGTLAAITGAIQEADVFVFTLGLTEAWINKTTGHVYPMCPGTVGGLFDEQVHVMHNYKFQEVLDSVNDIFDIAKQLNSKIRFLLTVSPVPLTATASGNHVLTATTHSKSVLRAVAGELAQSRPDVEYFPSYDIISGFPFRGMFYEPNLRAVTNQGVTFVMRALLAGIQPPGTQHATPSAGFDTPQALDPDLASFETDDPICDEILLDAFNKVTP
jgi:hypothetical protein